MSECCKMCTIQSWWTARSNGKCRYFYQTCWGMIAPLCSFVCTVSQNTKLFCVLYLSLAAISCLHDWTWARILIELGHSILSCTPYSIKSYNQTSCNQELSGSRNPPFHFSSIYVSSPLLEFRLKKLDKWWHQTECQETRLFDPSSGRFMTTFRYDACIFQLAFA